MLRSAPAAQAEVLGSLPQELAFWEQLAPAPEQDTTDWQALWQYYTQRPLSVEPLPLPSGQILSAQSRQELEGQYGGQILAIEPVVPGSESLRLVFSSGDTKILNERFRLLELEPDFDSLEGV